MLPSVAGGTCKDNHCTHPEISDSSPLRGKSWFLFVCGPHWTPTPGTCTGPAFSHIDLPGVQPALPTCNHLSLQVCDPGSETKSKRKVVGTREGPGVLQAEPRLREN